MFPLILFCFFYQVAKYKPEMAKPLPGGPGSAQLTTCIDLGGKVVKYYLKFTLNCNLEQFLNVFWFDMLNNFLLLEPIPGELIKSKLANHGPVSYLYWTTN